jgi:hypothetical protein
MPPQNPPIPVSAVALDSRISIQSIPTAPKVAPDHVVLEMKRGGNVLDAAAPSPATLAVLCFQQVLLPYIGEIHTGRARLWSTQRTSESFSVVESGNLDGSYFPRKTNVPGRAARVFRRERD